MSIDLCSGFFLMCKPHPIRRVDFILLTGFKKGRITAKNP